MYEFVHVCAFALYMSVNERERELRVQVGD